MRDGDSFKDRLRAPVPLNPGPESHILLGKGEVCHEFFLKIAQRGKFPSKIHSCLAGSIRYNEAWEKGSIITVREVAHDRAPGAVDALAASHYDMLVIEPARTDYSET